MRKKKKKIQAKRRKQRAGPPPVRCMALMVVDSSRIRRQSMGNCKRARTTFEKAERELEVFESRDRPAFVRWYRAVFGPRIGEIKSFSEQIQNLRMTMARVDQFAELANCSRHRAAKLHEDAPDEFERREREYLDSLQRAAERQQRELEEKREADAQTLRSEFGDFIESHAKWIRHLRKTGASPEGVFYELLTVFCNEQVIFPPDVTMALNHPEGVALLDRYDLSAGFDLEDGSIFDALIDELFDADSDEDEDLDAFGDLVEEPRPAVNSERDQARLAFLRRQLAFTLHPDQSDSDTDPAKMKLWYQVQEAVENRDLDRLEVLYAHCQMLCGDLSLQTPVSRLQALTDMYRRSRDALRRRIRALRKEPEWGFSVLDETSRNKMRRDLERQLNQQVEQLRMELTMAQEIYRRNFVRPSGRTVRSAAPVREQRDDPGQRQFDFFS